MTNELQLMGEALEKKNKILFSILEKSETQRNLTLAENFDVDEFDRLVDEKSKLLNEMEEIDQGFDSLFQRIKGELQLHIEEHRDAIGRLQNLIREMMDIGAQICACESRTKDSMQNALANSRKELAKRRISSKSVMDYYKSNSQMSYTEPYFMDQKK